MSGRLFEHSIDDALALRRSIDIATAINWLAAPFALVIGWMMARIPVIAGHKWGLTVGLLAAGFWLALAGYLTFVLSPDLEIVDRYGGYVRSAELFTLIVATLVGFAALSGISMNALYVWRVIGASRADRTIAAPLDPSASLFSALVEPLIPLRGYRRAPVAGLVAALASLVSTILRGAALAFLIPAIALRYARYWILWITIIYGAVVGLADSSGPLLGVVVSALTAALKLLLVIGVWVLLVLISAAIFLVARMIDHLASFLIRQSFSELSKRDARPPILFLRSFEDDQVTIERQDALFEVLAWKAMQPRIRRLDHILVEKFSRYGPVVAIGRPGERFLPFGAARLYVNDDQWQERVIALAEKASAVVVVTSSTPGLRWEITTMLERFPEKTVFLSPPGPVVGLGISANKEVMAHLVEKFAVRVQSDDTIALFGLTSSDWISLGASRHEASEYELALQAFFRRDRLTRALSNGSS